MKDKNAFQIHANDNVATALEELEIGEAVRLFGEVVEENVDVIEKIPMGHKIATMDIQKGESIIKYGVVIGRSIVTIKKGSWVHLHVLESLYDSRSEHLDKKTGAPKDIKYT